MSYQLCLEILSKEQNQILSFIEKFNRKYILVGGTAIALQLGHRKSIDFDLFLPNKEKLPMKPIYDSLKNNSFSYLLKTNLEYCRTIILNDVQVTRFAYMYDIPKNELIDWETIKIPSLIHLAAMKAHALGQRSKWKDYVDLYFLIREFGIKDIISYTKSFLGAEFNPRLFLSQLSYFENINYSEKVERMPGFEVSEEEIKDFLEKESINI